MSALTRVESANRIKQDSCIRDGDVIHLRADSSCYMNVNISNAWYGQVFAQATSQHSTTAFVITKATQSRCDTAL